MLAEKLTPMEILKDLERLHFLSTIPLQDFYYLAIYNYNGVVNSCYVSSAVGKNFSHKKKYRLAFCHKELFIFENERGGVFRRKKQDGFLSSKSLAKLPVEFFNRHLPVYYSENLEAWVVRLD